MRRTEIGSSLSQVEEIPLDRREARRLAQRQAMLDAAVDLARVGGYDAVQMREIADRVGMSPGSVYNYFASKDALLSTIMVDWTRSFAGGVAARPPVGADVAERIIDTLSRALHNLTKEPRLAEALLMAVRQHTRETHDPRAKDTVHHFLVDALGHCFDPSFPVDDRDEIVGILSHVWYALLIGWAADWYSSEQVIEELRVAARRLTRPFEPHR